MSILVYALDLEDVLGEPVRFGHQQNALVQVLNNLKLCVRKGRRCPFSPCNPLILMGLTIGSTKPI